jgi:hypothetical protein
MPNEFVVKNGLIAQNNIIVTGSISATGGITGSLSGNAATASYVVTAQTASYVATATTASYVLNAQSASYVLNAQSASYVLNARSASYVLNARSASYVQTATTASYVLNAQSASRAISSSYALTSSYADSFTVGGTLTAQTLVVQTITSSQDFVTGSTRFGSISANTHQFTGSVGMSGSLNVLGASTLNTATVSSLTVTGSGTIASYNSDVLEITGSLVVTGSAVITGSLDVNGGITGSLLGTATTASYAALAESATSAATSSYVNPLSQSVILTGSLTVANPGATDVLEITGSLIVSGSSTLVGTQIITGSLTVNSNGLFVSSSGVVGVGTTSPTQKFQTYNSSNGTSAAFGGTSYGIRIDNGGTFSSGRSTIFGVDNTFYSSYQPIALGGSEIYFSIAGTDKVTISSNGVKFQNGASSLNYYEEGTWTPAFGGAGSPSYSTQFGRYTRIGNMVYCTIALRATSISGGSVIQITGLPFSAGDASDTGQRATFSPRLGGHINGVTEATARFRVNGNYMDGVKGDLDTTYMTAAQFCSGGSAQITGQFWYYV